jgi:hypothetical protein
VKEREGKERRGFDSVLDNLMRRWSVSGVLERRGFVVLRSPRRAFLELEFLVKRGCGGSGIAGAGAGAGWFVGFVGVFPCASPFTSSVVAVVCCCVVQVFTFLSLKKGANMEKRSDDVSVG